jgi:hypothetical protein
MALNNTKVSRATGAAAIAFELSRDTNWMVYEVRVHLNAAATQDTLTIRIDSSANAVYDAVLYSQDMSGHADFVWRPTRPIFLQANDQLEVAWTNTDTRTYGVEVIYV